MGIHHIGNREVFALEIGRVQENEQLRTVEIWADGRHLTCNDNSAFVPQFCADVDWSIAQILSERDLQFPHPTESPEENYRRLCDEDSGEREEYRFLDWGPTTDNVSSLIFRRGDEMFITFQFRRDGHRRSEERGRVFAVKINERALLSHLHETACVLKYGR